MNATEIVVALLVLVSGFLSMAAGIGIIRFPDVLTRLHAATKPQVLGLAAILLAIVLRVPTWGVLTTVVLIMTFQLLTQPMTAHMLGRSAYRTAHVRHDLLIEDALGHDIAEHAEDFTDATAELEDEGELATGEHAPSEAERPPRPE
ncbi:monovalent cation/H(+) antiporter subunit G [Agromyces sp. MMS24-K17]|uniref:monovalent cation/H(+) antiporter subunit G n=1 Tax=Agromyces sp. MMS24-K17 TaxID=3372850 RepID=UPI0037551C43